MGQEFQVEDFVHSLSCHSICPNGSFSVFYYRSSGRAEPLISLNSPAAVDQTTPSTALVGTSLIADKNAEVKPKISPSMDPAALLRLVSQKPELPLAKIFQLLLLVERVDFIKLSFQLAVKLAG